MRQATATDDTDTIKNPIASLDAEHTVKALCRTVRGMKGFTVDLDETAGTVTIHCKGWTVYRAIRKGAKGLPWIAR